MLRTLERDIRDQAALVIEDRLALSAHAHGFRALLRSRLASREAVLGSFCLGLVLGLLRRRHPAPAEDGEAGEPAPSKLMRTTAWLLRDVVMPMALAAMTQARAEHQHESDADAGPG